MRKQNNQKMNPMAKMESDTLARIYSQISQIVADLYETNGFEYTHVTKELSKMTSKINDLRVGVLNEQ